MNLYTIKELSNKIKYSVNTLYKKKKEMILGVHYFQTEKGKILFSDEAVTFFLNSTKGEHDESIKRDTIQEKKQPISLSEYIG